MRSFPFQPSRSPLPRKSANTQDVPAIYPSENGCILCKSTRHCPMAFIVDVLEDDFEPQEVVPLIKLDDILDSLYAPDCARFCNEILHEKCLRIIENQRKQSYFFAMV